MLKCKPRERRPCGRETISTMGPAPRSCVRPFKKIKTNIKAMLYPDLLNLCILFAEAFDYAFLRYATATPAKTALFPTSTQGLVTLPPPPNVDVILESAPANYQFSI